jgi:hypothetical protein
MKYISALEYSVKELTEKHDNIRERMDEFKVHLYSDKFKEDNSISVADVLRWIDYIKWGN